MDQLAPEMYAGEGFSSGEEIAKPSDVANPWVRGMAENPEAYWPGQSVKKKKKK